LCVGEYIQCTLLKDGRESTAVCSSAPPADYAGKSGVVRGISRGQIGVIRVGSLWDVRKMKTRYVVRVACDSTVDETGVPWELCN